MFIESGKSEDIPKDAIRMTKDEVLEYMSDRIRKWPNTLEIWALKYGNPILSSAVVLSNTGILNFYRRKLQLRNYGRFTLFLPVVLIPSIFDQIYQSEKTTNSIILQDDCPTCISTQSMFIQLGTGIVYPLLSSIGGTYMFATKMNTIAIFGGNNAFDMAQQFAKHVWKNSQTIYNRLTVMVIGHLLLSFAITYYQTEHFEFLRLKMYEQHIEELELFHQRKNISKKITN